MTKDIYSLCFMCSIRCPIRVIVEKGQVKWIEGNAHVSGMDTSLCPRGAAGIALLNDRERLQYPQIREGRRGEGKWRRVSWDEALDYISAKLKDIMDQHGPESVTLGERANLGSLVSKAFMKAIGSPNYFSHDALCKGSANTAFRSLFGYTDAQMGADFKGAKHIVLYGRNLFESIEVKPSKALMSAITNGTKLTYIDPRVTVTATKSHRYWMIRPGTDLALNYALIHVILKEKCYDAEFVNRWVLGFPELETFVEPYTPEWAQRETGIPAAEIRELARESAALKPTLFFHGYRSAHHTNEIYMRRSTLMLNALMGNIERPGGYFFKKGPGEAGGKSARKLTDQKFLAKSLPVRFDKVGTPDFPLPDPAHGVPQTLPQAILNSDPYPIKALIANRFDIIGSMPDSNLTRKALDKLDLIVAIDINYSNIAWYADVLLPESIYLERTDCVQQANGLKPQMFLRKQAVTPRYDTREAGMIFKGLADRLGIGQFFPYQNMEDLVAWQLSGTGFSMADFEAKGFVAYGKDMIYWDRNNGLDIKTPSGKIEFKSALMEDAGIPSFPAYESMPSPPEGHFRLLTGRVAQHTHVSTQNNLYLNELFPENVLWMHREKAKALGINDGDQVLVSSASGSGTIKAFVSDLIHPEAVFLVHGFGHKAHKATRSFEKGLSDAELQENITDKVGGSPALHHTFVTVRKSEEGGRS
jgi:thiosulfate reductase/polysulfide reductase chain A